MQEIKDDVNFQNGTLQTIQGHVNELNAFLNKHGTLSDDLTELTAWQRESAQLFSLVEIDQDALLQMQACFNNKTQYTSVQTNVTTVLQRFNTWNQQLSSKIKAVNDKLSQEEKYNNLVSSLNATLESFNLSDDCLWNEKEGVLNLYNNYYSILPAEYQAKVTRGSELKTAYQKIQNMPTDDWVSGILDKLVPTYDSQTQI